MVRTCSHEILCNNDGDWVVDWLANKIVAIGPATDIDDFKKKYISLGSVNNRLDNIFRLEHVMPTPPGLEGINVFAWRNDNWGSDREPWGVDINPESSPWCLSFSFESGGGFPKPMFERLAEEYPTISFYCHSTEFSDDYVEAGWFNPPSGCNDFDVIFDIDEHWPATGPVCDPIAEIRHERTMAYLKRAAQAASQS